MADIGVIGEIRTIDGQHVVTVDSEYGPSVTATVMQGGGVDFMPMAGDRVLFHRAGKEVFVSAIFSEDSESSIGESLIFSRNPSGLVMATIHAKSDGSVEIKPTTTVSVGDGVDFVAMSTAVTAMWTALETVCNNFAAPSPDGGAALATAIAGAVAAAKSTITISSSNLKAD